MEKSHSRNLLSLTMKEFARSEEVFPCGLVVKYSYGLVVNHWVVVNKPLLSSMEPVAMSFAQHAICFCLRWMLFLHAAGSTTHAYCQVWTFFIQALAFSRGLILLGFSSIPHGMHWLITLRCSQWKRVASLDFLLALPECNSPAGGSPVGRCSGFTSLRSSVWRSYPWWMSTAPASEPFYCQPTKHREKRLFHAQKWVALTDDQWWCLKFETASSEVLTSLIPLACHQGIDGISLSELKSATVSECPVRLVGQQTIELKLTTKINMVIDQP